MEYSANTAGASENTTLDTSAITSVFSDVCHSYTTISALSIINFLCAYNATILTIALPAIANDIPRSAIPDSWASVSFMLASTLLQPIWALISPILGSKTSLTIAQSLFTAGSLIAGLAPDFAALFVGRSIQGIGGAGIVILTQTLLHEIALPENREIWTNVINLSWYLGAIIGPIIGGTFATINWRWLFWLNLPVCGMVLVAIQISMKSKPYSEISWKSLKGYDWLGWILIAISITVILVPLTWGGVTYYWNSWHTIIPSILGSLGVLGFIFRSIAILNPILPKVAFSTMKSWISYFSAVIHGMTLWSVLYYIPLYFQVAKNLSPLEAGIALFALTIPLGLGALGYNVFEKFVNSRLKARKQIMLFIGWFLTIGGTCSLIFLDTKTSTSSWIIRLLLASLGYGILYPTIADFTTSFPTSSPETDIQTYQSATNSTYTIFKSLGQTLGVAIGGVIFQNSLKYYIDKSTLLSSYGEARSKEWVRNATGMVDVIRKMENGELRRGLVDGYRWSLRILWLAMLGGCVVAAVGCACFLRERRVERVNNRIVESREVGEEDGRSSPGRSETHLIQV